MKRKNWHTTVGTGLSLLTINNKIVQSRLNFSLVLRNNHVLYLLLFLKLYKYIFLLGLNSSCTPSGSGQQAEIGKIIDKYTLLEDVDKQQQEQKQELVEFDNLFLVPYLPI